MLAQVASRHYPLWVVRMLRITLFTALIAISARIVIPVPGTPVPITMQVLSVLLAGMVLGPVEGALSVAAYVGAIAAGAPIDAYGRGTASLFSPTAGFLIGFIPAASIAGLGWRLPERRKLVASIVLGFIALIAVYFFGLLGLLPISLGSWTVAFAKGAVPFLFVDFGKVLLAASLATLGRESWLRWGLPRTRPGSDK